ncbi:MAG: pantetheine-phosphate adenylyltransferase [Eubacterium sp.]|nr:pantetheine-phosphate adenylyltransferase [Eubacterium sp.]
MKCAVYPGSFDPVTFGHLDIIERAAALFDKVVVCVMVNYKKKYIFSEEERAALLKESVAHLPNVTIECFSGLLIDYMQKNNYRVLIKGLRNSQDFEFELSMERVNRHLCPEVETMFLMADNTHSYLSASVVRELMAFGGEVSDFVPPQVAEALRIKYGKDRAK